MKKTNKKLLQRILNQIESEWFAQPTRSRREIVREVFAEYLASKKLNNSHE